MSIPLLYKAFTEETIPHWRCPACLNETLEIVPGSFFKEETSETRLGKNEFWFEPDHHYKTVFSCLLRCSRKACLEPVAITGIGWVDRDVDYEAEAVEKRRARPDVLQHFPGLRVLQGERTRCRLSLILQGSQHAGALQWDRRYHRARVPQLRP